MQNFIENKMIVGDIDHKSLHPECITLLDRHIGPTYKDQVVKEHIYNIGDVIEYLEDDENEKIHQDAIDQFYTISANLNSIEAGYFRILFN
jgi:hypothetical protein